MTLTPRRALVMLAYMLVLIFALLSALADVTNNEGLWKLGGEVGPARWTIACFLLVGVGGIAQALNGNGGPFRPAP